MENNFYKNVLIKVIALLLCIYIAIFPLFKLRKVEAIDPVLLLDKIVIATTVTVAYASVFYVGNYVIFTPEQITKFKDNLSAELKKKYPVLDDYNKHLSVLQNMSERLLNGEKLDWTTFEGQLLYSLFNSCFDTFFQNQAKPEGVDPNKILYYLQDGSYVTWGKQQDPAYNKRPLNVTFESPFEDRLGYTIGPIKYYLDYTDNFIIVFKHIVNGLGKEAISFYGYTYPDDSVSWYGYPTHTNDLFFINLFGGQTRFQTIPSIKEKTKDKIQLPNRLPQSVINNYNNYINGTEPNLIINPTPEELPKLPDNFDPNKDEVPTFPGWTTVTPDQPGTVTPPPTPTPSPTPTPTPPPAQNPWVNPIGEFLAGLMEFLNAALVPTLAIDPTPLQNIGTNIAGKFPFSLPADIGKLFGILNAEPLRPHFQMAFDLSKVGIPGEPIHYDLDLTQWDEAAGVVKTAIYIAFLIGLVFISKEFMKN